MVASDGPSGRVVAVGTAGHVLDYDDTYLPGICHLSAPVASAALVVGAKVEATVGEVLEAYAAGVETMAAIARASHPALYDRGWHPTSVCGAVGAARASAVLLQLNEPTTARALSLALLRTGGLRASFGSHGKSIQVGLAAAQGSEAARLAAAGATILSRVRAGFESAYGARWATPEELPAPAITENWIKAYPCCLQTHSAIEAAERARRDGVAAGKLTITVHPVSRQAAGYDDVADGLQAKFSIPYLAEFTLLHGPPRLSDFESVDRASRDLISEVEVRTDRTLLESQAVLTTPDGYETSVDAALGSPAHPMTEEQLKSKVRELAGGALEGALESPSEPANGLLTNLGL
jgi:2-methylcitrate dehydratase PrpD